MERQEPKGPPPAYQPQYEKNYAEPYHEGASYGFDDKRGYDGQGYPPNQYPYGQQVYGQQQQVYGQQPVYQQQPAPYMQPAYLYASPLPQCTGPPPKSYSMFAWLTCCFCCWPISLIAIFKSCEVSNAVSQGDMERAKKASEAARKLSVASVFCGLGLYLVGIIILVFFVILIPDVSKHHYA